MSTVLRHRYRRRRMKDGSQGHFDYFRWERNQAAVRSGDILHKLI